VSWLFFLAFGSLMLASLTFCGEDSSLRNWRPSLGPQLDPADRRAFSAFIRSNEAVPDPRFAPAVLAWAEVVLRQERCRWDRYLNWAWVIWITTGVLTAILFGSARDVATRLIFFDLLLLVVVARQFSLRRANAIVAATGRIPGGQPRRP
jgi:hypothetical protein